MSRLLRIFVVACLFGLGSSSNWLEHARRFVGFCDHFPPLQPTWFCFFSVDPVIKCQSILPNGQANSSFQFISSRLDIQSLPANRYAFINISECTSKVSTQLRIDLLAGFENFVVSFGESTRNTCPDLNILSSVFKRISHPARCLVLANVTESLLSHTQYFEKFESLRQFILLDSDVQNVPTQVSNFIRQSDIEELIITNTELTEFRLENNRSLAYINLSNNKLSHFAIPDDQSYPKIVTIDVSNNRLFISPRFFRLNYQLSAVDLSNCNLRSLDDLVGHLHSLNLSRNRITEIKNSTFYRIDSLAVLDLSYNQLSQLPNSPLGAHLSLVELNLSHNQISEIPEQAFGNSSFLRRLDLSFNNIKTVTSRTLNLTLMSALSFLNLANNRLVSFPAIEPRSDSLKILLSSNLLTSLNVLPTAFNRYLMVNAANNSISNYRKVNVGMLQWVRSIDMLMWDPSAMPDWASKTATRTIHVDLSSNLISALEAHFVMANLVIKPYNHFGVVSFYNFSGNPVECSCDLRNNIEYLTEAFNVSTNQHIDVVNQQVLSFLNMKCRMETKSVSKLIPFRQVITDAGKRLLRCSDDPLRCPNECFCYFDKKSGLNKAECSECDCLYEMPVSMPPDTSVIHLEDNFIRSIGCKRYLRSVKKLFMQNNLIKKIDDCLYWYLKNVTVIRLDSNHLSNFPYKMAYIASLTHNSSVYLSNNTFVCECDEDVKDGFEHFGGRLFSPESIECRTDDGHRHRYLDYLKTCWKKPEKLISYLGYAVQPRLLWLISIVSIFMVLVIMFVYYMCCFKHVVALGHQVAKLRRCFGSDASRLSSQSRRRNRYFNCLQSIRNYFTFSNIRPQADDGELIIANDGNDVELADRFEHCDSDFL